MRLLETVWYFVILLLSLVLILETLETVRLKRSLRALGNTLEASRIENAKLLEKVARLESENQALRKCLENLRALVEEVSKSLGRALNNPELAVTIGSVLGVQALKILSLGGECSSSGLLICTGRESLSRRS